MTTTAPPSSADTDASGPPGTGATTARPAASRPRPRRRYQVVTALAVVVVAAGVAAPAVVGGLSDPSATDLIQADPPPTLFPDDSLGQVRRTFATRVSPASRLMQQWWSQHDATPDDAAFLTWVEQQVPQPPAPRERTQELAQVTALSAGRTTAGVAAATWLEEYGKEDIWKLFLHDQRELLPASVGDTEQVELNDALNMARDAADALGATYQQSAPYVIDPSLRTDHTVAPGDVCPCSYPSRHAAAGGAAVVYLSYLAPPRSAEYREMAAQIDYSRLYMAGHVLSDLRAGDLLGDMIGEYFLVTRGHEPVPTA